MPQDEEHIQHAERDRWHREEVDGRDLASFSMPNGQILPRSDLHGKKRKSLLNKVQGVLGSDNPQFWRKHQMPWHYRRGVVSA